MSTMTTEILYSPLAEVRWAHLVEPRQQMDPEKPLAWSVDLLLPLGEATSQVFLEKLERQFVEAHGSKKRRSDKGEPWKLDKEQPNQLMVVKFKAQQLTRRDGSQASGPRLIDASKQPWNGSDGGVLAVAVLQLAPGTRVDAVGGRCSLHQRADRLLELPSLTPPLAC